MMTDPGIEQPLTPATAPGPDPAPAPIPWTRPPAYDETISRIAAPPGYAPGGYAPPADVPPAYAPPVSAPAGYLPPPAVPTGYPQVGYGVPTMPGMPPYAGGVRAPAKRRIGVTAFVVSAIAIAVVFAGAGFGAGIVVGHKSPSSANGTSAGGPASNAPVGGGATAVPTDLPTIEAQTPTAPADPNTGKALLAKIIEAPAGSRSINPGHSDKGVWATAADYTAEYYPDSTTMTGALVQMGFVAAAGRNYVTPNGDEIATHIVQFSSSDGAQRYYDIQNAALTADDSVTDTFAVTDGGGWEFAKPDTVGNERTQMWAQVGNLLLDVNVYTPGSISTKTDLQIFNAQLARLQ